MKEFKDIKIRLNQSLNYLFYQIKTNYFFVVFKKLEKQDSKSIL